MKLKFLKVFGLVLFTITLVLLGGAIYNLVGHLIEILP